VLLQAHACWSQIMFARCNFEERLKCAAATSLRTVLVSACSSARQCQSRERAQQLGFMVAAVPSKSAVGFDSRGSTRVAAENMRIFR